MSSNASAADLSRLYGIDDECAELIRQNHDFLFREFSAALDAAYQLASKSLSLDGRVADPGVLARAREQHIRHWGVMMQATFGEDYEASLAAVHWLRNDFGIEFRVSAAWRTFIIGAVLNAIVLRLPRKWWEFSPGRRRAKLQLAYFKVSMLDTVMTVDGYLAAEQDDRLRTFSHLAKSFEHAVGGIVSGVATAAEDLRGTADALTSSAEETNKQSMAVALASRDAEANVQAVASATHHLSHAIGEVSARVHESNEVAGRAAGKADETQDAVDRLSDAAERIGGSV